MFPDLRLPSLSGSFSLFFFCPSLFRHDPPGFFSEHFFRKLSLLDLLFKLSFFFLPPLNLFPDICRLLFNLLALFLLLLADLFLTVLHRLSAVL